MLCKFTDCRLLRRCCWQMTNNKQLARSSSSCGCAGTDCTVLPVIQYSAGHDRKRSSKNNHNHSRSRIVTDVTLSRYSTKIRTETFLIFFGGLTPRFPFSFGWPFSVIFSRHSQRRSPMQPQKTMKVLLFTCATLNTINTVGANTSNTRGFSAAAGGSTPALDKILSEQKQVEDPSFSHHHTLFFSQENIESSCERNSIVQGWCPQHNCALVELWNEYGCHCPEEDEQQDDLSKDTTTTTSKLPHHHHHHSASLCPLECIEGSEILEHTRTSIRCRGIPIDHEPNYILRSKIFHEDQQHCENNALVSGWCDDNLDPHLDCRLYTDSYECHCSKANACPLECIAGEEPIERSSKHIKCGKIPLDQPNYVIV